MYLKNNYYIRFFLNICTKNFITYYEYEIQENDNKRTIKTNNEKIFGYIFFEDMVAYFLRRRINRTGRIIMSDRGAI